MEEILINYNFKLQSRGFDYWILAIDIAKKNPRWRIGYIYEEIGNIYNTSYRNIEKAMRDSRINSTINKKLRKDKITNSEVLRLLLIEERRM